MKLSTRGKQGKLAKTITVFSSDPDQPQLTLKVSAQIEVLLGLEPDRVVLRQILQGTRSEQAIKLSGKLADAAKILSVESSRPELKAEVGAQDGKPVIKLVFQAPEKPERFNANVTVKTDQQAVKELRLFFSAEVTGDLVLSAPFVMFTTFDEAKPPVYTLTVRSLGARPFKITKVEDSNGVVTGRVTTAGAETQIALTLTKAPPTPRGKLKLFTDRKDQPFLEAQYNVRPKNAPPVGPAVPMVRGGPAAGKQPIAPGLKPTPIGPIQRTPLKIRTAPPPAGQPPPKTP